MMLLIFSVCCLTFISCSSPIVRVEQGELAGTFYELPNGRIVNAFLGIPYAAPPIFKNRFKEPQQLKPWVGVWNATKLQSWCLQIEHRRLYEISGEEDCLYLNIYTPKLPVDGVDNPLMNVLVYFHGGAFMFASGGIYYPDYIQQDHDIVFVNINYRLGALGFFSTGDNVAPGNFGLKDQVAALKWIQRNIIHFGGNPDSVTIAGSSAGGASVHYHFISPLSKGLFHKGASLSANVFHPWTLPRNVPQKSTHLAALVGCPIDNNREMVKCLQKRPARAIVEQLRNFMVWRYCPFSPFGPTVEPESPNAFLSSHPLELVASGKVKDLPWMTGVTEKEGLYPGAEFMAHDHLLKELNDNWYEIAPNLLMYNYSVPEKERDAVSDAIRNFYFGDKPICKETRDQLVQMLGDRFFYNEIFDITKLHSSATKNEVYCYKFNYRGKYSLTNVYAKNSENYGSSHSDDISYFLRYLPSSSEETKADKAMTKLVSSIYVNFMKTGNPAIGVDAWKPVAKDQNPSLMCLNINSADDLVYSDITNAATSKFWKNVLSDEYSSNLDVVRRDEL
ncbi:esterase E4-like [Planococcus citri]|uniref:esterase E4-like n=1 Tax=Planococcus citri TaxID=170843 RepID=UPI0031F8B314